MEWAFILIPSISVVAWLLYEAWGRRPTTIKVPELVELPKAFVYDWVRDDGYLWTGPGDTAFWLEPETCDELAAWCARYRPTDYGLYAVSDDVRIEWMEPIPAPRRISNRPYQQQSGLQNAYQQDYQNELQNILQNPYQNAYQQSFNIQRLNRLIRGRL